MIELLWITPTVAGAIIGYVLVRRAIVRHRSQGTLYWPHQNKDATRYQATQALYGEALRGNRYAKKLLGIRAGLITPTKHSGAWATTTARAYAASLYEQLEKRK